MMEQYFTCTFKTDIVLHGSSNTEGKIDLLDFIPGSNFLGMVAKKYTSYKSDAFDIFHSGKVCFGDAHVAVDDKISYKAPFIYFTQKGKEPSDKIYNHLYLDDKTELELKQNGIQLKQLREGFMTNDGQYRKLQHSYAQKSAYDKSSRSSKDGSMFGYYSLAKDSKFIFCISFDDSLDEAIVKKVVSDISGIQALGKSKSAQYGRVEIKALEQKPDEVQELISDDKKRVFIYAKSRIALHDENGMPTFKPSVYNLKLPNGCKINLDMTQIRTLTYSPYNGARRVRDHQRVVIEKGSVIAVDVDDSFDMKEYQNSIKNGIGSYLSEGFGKVLINPSFLMEKEPQLAKYKKDSTKDYSSDSPLAKWLVKQQQKKSEQYELFSQVHSFIEENYKSYKNTKTSQWGTIRSFANEKDPISAIESYLAKGVAKEQWSDKVETITKAIKKSKHPQKFTKLLAMEMSKKIKQDEIVKEPEYV